jgi:hypothetical protein
VDLVLATRVLAEAPEALGVEAVRSHQAGTTALAAAAVLAAAIDGRLATVGLENAVFTVRRVLDERVLVRSARAKKHEPHRNGQQGSQAERSQTTH